MTDTNARNRHTDNTAAELESPGLAPSPDSAAGPGVSQGLGPITLNITIGSILPADFFLDLATPTGKVQILAPLLMIPVDLQAWLLLHTLHFCQTCPPLR
jgi:hypothetical protein